jgi:hypothetical protein
MAEGEEEENRLEAAATSAVKTSPNSFHSRRSMLGEGAEVELVADVEDDFSEAERGDCELEGALL